VRRAVGAAAASGLAAAAVVAIVAEVAVGPAGLEQTPAVMPTRPWALSMPL